MMLMTAITYVFAMIMRQMTDDSELGDESFSSVPKAAYTLMLESMLPDNAEMMTNCGDQAWYLGVVFWIYMFLGALTVMNMLIGIVCEVMSEVSDTEKAKLESDQMTQALQSVLQEIDQDFDGFVSKDEVASMMDNSEAIAAMRSS